MPLYTTLCTVHNGRLKVLHLEHFNRGVAGFCDGEEIELTLESVAEHHSRAQEKFFHGPVLAAFIKLGWGKQEAKDMLALRFIPQEIRLPDDTIVRVPGHTSAQSKQTYTRFIEECIQLAAELGEPVEDAEDWLQRHRRAA